MMTNYGQSFIFDYSIPGGGTGSKPPSSLSDGYFMVTGVSATGVVVIGPSNVFIVKTISFAGNVTESSNNPVITPPP